MRGFFVTGTDTGVGKTWVSVALMHALQEHGFRVLGMKPVASGCAKDPEGLRSEDGLLLQGAGSKIIPYERVNPYAFEPAIAPHLAAHRANVTIDMQALVAEAHLLAGECDYLVVEGVGGWYVPLGGNNVCDLAVHMDLPVVLVVGMRLGCINHALLTAECIVRSGLNLAGWVANQIDPHMEAFAENVQALAELLSAPLLGVLPHIEEGYGKEPALDLQPLMRTEDRGSRF